MKRIIPSFAATLLFLAACSGEVSSPVAPSSSPRPSTSVSTTSTLLIDTGPGSTSSAGSVGLFASGSTTCSPQPSCGASFQFIAGEFTLASATNLESVEGWMYNGAGSIDVVIRSNNGGLPGAIVYSQNYSATSHYSPQWVTFPAFNSNLAAGTYWLSFEPPAGSAFSGGLPGGVANPLVSYAFLSNGNLGLWHQITANPYGDGHPGIRIYGAVALTPAQMIDALGATIAGFGLPKGTRTSFDAKLNAAQSAIVLNQTANACSSLQDLINAVKAQSGKKISSSDASTVITTTMGIRSALGC